MSCRIIRRRKWQNRLLLEAMLADKTAFITLTYDEESLPKDKSLKPKHLKAFIKALRKKLNPIKLRYYAVGEYGFEKNRPHYHIAAFFYV